MDIYGCTEWKKRVLEINCTQTCSARRVALNVRPSLAINQLECHKYEYKLYKIKSDSCTFDNLDELFDAEELTYENSCDFHNDWMPFEENNLQPGLSAILVANTPVMDFSRHPLYKFTVYVRYEIRMEGGKVCALQLMAGEVEITPQIFFTQMFGTQCHERKYIYRDFLAIASTSSYRVIHIEGACEISQQFNCFLMEDLKFQRASLPETSVVDEGMPAESHGDVEMRDDSHFMATNVFGNQKTPTAVFYQQDGFWRGALIRIKEINKSKLTLKVYMRTHNHLAVFLKAIKMDFGTKVEISNDENSQDTIFVIRSLVDEITFKRYLIQMLPEWNEMKSKEFFGKILYSELKTNFAYRKFTSK